MKVTIERSISYSIDVLIEANFIVSLLTNCESLEDVIKKLDAYTPQHFKYGRGSSHIWVTPINSNERYLLITV